MEQLCGAAIWSGYMEQLCRAAIWSGYMERLYGAAMWSVTRYSDQLYMYLV